MCNCSGRGINEVGNDRLVEEWSFKGFVYIGE